MNTNKTCITALTLGLALSAAPAFAQRGLGIGHAAINAGSEVATAAGQVGSNAGVKANAGVQAGASTQANTAAGAKGGTAAAAAGAGIVTRIEDNPQLAGRVQSMLPSGESLSTAAAGFKNEGQFLAALNVSHNLDIPFDGLKAKMTGSDAMSLGAAIHALKPEISAEEAKELAKKAERQAKEDAEKGGASAKSSTSAVTGTATTSANATSGSRLGTDADDKTKAAASAATTTSAH